MKDKADNNKKGAEPETAKPKLWVPETAKPVAKDNTSVSPDNKDKTCAATPKTDSGVELAKLQEEIESLRKAASERNEFLNLLQRVQADFANYQKRIKKEKECWDKYQDEGLLRELLPALDNFDRTLKQQCTSEETKCVINGVDLIKREIFRVLDKRGIKPIKTVGETLDPNFHEAVGVCEAEKCKENEIVEEIAPGYMLHDRLLRAAKVKIAKPKPVGKEEKPKGNV